MEILQLKYFCHAAKTENFSHTALKFGVPPSNISQCIRRLESELDCKLFDRGKNAVRLNNAGTAFYEKISKALELIESAKKDIEKSDKTKEIKICSLTNRQLVMRATEKLRARREDIKIVISHSYSENENFDLIISDEDFLSNVKKRKLIVSEKIVAAINKKNPLSQKTVITADDLKKENFVCLNDDSNLHKATLKICDKMNFKPKIVIQSPDPFYVRKCVELNLGITFFPSYSWSGMFSEYVHIADIGDFWRNTYAYVNNLGAHGEVEELVDIMTEVVKL